MEARQPIQIILLNDCILVASRKKRTMSSKMKLVADRCWALNDVRGVDVKNSSDLTNAVKVIYFQDVYYFRCERPEDKAGLLATLKRITDELMENTEQN